MRSLFRTICTLCLALTACDDPDDLEALEPDEEEADEADPVEFRLFKGVNGDACAASTYNCKLRVSGGNRVNTNDPDDNDSWAVDKGVSVRDGNGTVVAVNDRSRITFNYGQSRKFGGVDHAMAVSTTNGSASWMPITSIAGESSFRDKLGHVSALGAGLAKLGCYEIKNSHDTTLELKKVVYDSKVTHERAGDYLPLQRKNGVRSANLAFNVPGFALGGVAIDHFPAGTKFQRYDVPTTAGPASIDIPLYVKDSGGRYRKQDGTMKFIYGYVVAATGTKRNGWMAYDALKVSSGCP